MGQVWISVEAIRSNVSATNHLAGETEMSTQKREWVMESGSYK